MDLKKHIRTIPDYPKKGILFRDITTLIKNADAFKYTNDRIIQLAKNIEFDKVAAIESRGFVFASTVSYLLKKPFVLLRKKNKLPAETYSVDFELEYGRATIEVHKDSIDRGEKILIIDDLIATGGTADAAAELVKMSGGKIAGFIFVINLFDLPGDQLLKDKGYLTKSLVDFPGH
jgi:adenine phosphoribosyltransferase